MSHEHRGEQDGPEQRVRWAIHATWDENDRGNALHFSVTTSHQSDCYCDALAYLMRVVGEKSVYDIRITRPRTVNIESLNQRDRECI
jgi:hypothetical protein